MTGEAKQQLVNATKGAAADAKGDLPSSYVQNAAYKAPGRLGDPKMVLKDDPRLNTKLLAILEPMGMAGFGDVPALSRLNENSSLEEISELISEFENGIMQIYNGAIPLDLATDSEEPELKMTEETIKGGDGQDMKVYVYRPADQGDRKLPCVVYTHGGGMTIVTTQNPVHDRWCRSMAVNGVVVIMPDFRNAYTKDVYSHFPKGLNDCAAAFKWASSNRDDLKISNIILQGESGGGNLATAVSLKANKEGWVKEIAGVYALVPYISNLWGISEERKLKELPSLIENHGYFLNCHARTYMGYFYTPSDEDSVNPLAWPYHATEADMKGLPPHVVVMDEMDKLRDEGISYARRLVKAGVPTKSAVNLGVVHGTSLLFRQALPELHRGIAREVAAFAKEV